MGKQIQLDKLVKIKGVNSAVLATRDGFLIDYASRVAVDAEGLASIAAICLQSHGSEVVFAHSHFVRRQIKGENMLLLIKNEHASSDQLGADWPFVFLYFVHDQTVALVCHRKSDLKEMFRQIIQALDTLGLRRSGFAQQAGAAK